MITTKDSNGKVVTLIGRPTLVVPEIDQPDWTKLLDTAKARWLPLVIIGDYSPKGTTVSLLEDDNTGWHLSEIEIIPACGATIIQYKQCVRSEPS